MNEVIRLTRLAMVLQILINCAMAVSSSRGQFRFSADNLVLILAITLPSVVVLLATVLVQRREWSSSRAVTGLLLGLIAAIMIEVVGSNLIGTLLAANEPPTFFIPLQTQLMFLFIPALLGGWVYGSRGALTWSALSIAAMLISLLCTVVIFRLNVRPNGFFIFRLPLEPLFVQACMLTIVCYFVSSLADRQRAEHRLLQGANQQLLEQGQVREQLAASHERLRLARDLHDILAHTMAGLLVQLRAIQELILSNPSAAQAELSVAEEATRQGLVDTRNAISNLRNSQVQDLGLAVSLRQILTLFEQRTGIPVQFDQRGDSTQIKDHMAEALYLIAQEALRNIERHAAASQVLVTLDTEQKKDQRCRLTIQDNGVGFDLRGVSENRFGLRGMEERGTLIGAQVDVRSILRQGTTITVAL